MRGPLVSTSWLAERLDDPEVVVADVRWYLQGKRGADEYARGHIPGAVFVDLDGELAAPPGPGRPGRHPLPDAARMSEVLARIGAGPESLVVGYDDAGGAIAARLWWLLRYFGHGGGRVLDGGIAAWIREGRPIEGEVRERPRADRLHLAPRWSMVVDKARVAGLVAHGGALVLDARPPERFEGLVEPVDSRPGHIPGAKNAPTARNLVAPEGPFLPAEELVRRYAAVGADRAETIVCHCGSGVTACHDILALSLAGRDDVLLYEGSWSDWSADPSLPAATGKD